MILIIEKFTSLEKEQGNGSADVRAGAARAKAEGIRIVGESAYNGNRAWVIENPAHDGQYVVRLAAGAKELTCSCPARVPCKHRALVHEAIEAERDPWMRNGQRITVGQLRAEREAALSQTRLWS